MTSDSRRIIFVRHGETAYNAENRLEGQRDVPLNDRGREQATAVGRALSAALADELARLDAAGDFYASSLLRARQTMELARAAMGLAPKRYQVSPELMEMSFGEWDGLTLAEVAARDPAAARAREADKWRFVPPGGESYAMLAERLEPWLAAQQADRFVASHGGVARALMTLIAGLDPAAAENAEIWQDRALLFEGGGMKWVG